MQTTFQNFTIPVIYNNNISAMPPSQTTLNKVKEKPLETKQKVAAYIGSTALAYGMAKVSKHLLNIFVAAPLHKTFIQSSRFTAEEQKACKEAGEIVLEKSGLKAKGVQIKLLDESSANRDELKRLIVKPRKRPLNLQKIPFIKKKLLKQAQKSYEAYINGENACYMHRGNKTVWINENKMMHTVFHELGHAKSRHAIITPLLALEILYKKNLPYLFFAAILLPKHKKEKLNAREKFDNAVINSLPYLILVGNVPTLVEEARASIYGREFAKKVLKPELFKKVITSYKKAYMTYIGATLSVAALYKLMIMTKYESDEEIRKYFKNKNQNKQSA